MAEAVIVKHGDTVTKILKTRRGIPDNKVFTWLPRIRKANPHISNLNRIYPGESLLIHDNPSEKISEARIIENAVARVPKELKDRRVDRTNLFITFGGAAVDDIAQKMFAGGRFQNLPLSTKRAVLIHNNPDIMKHLDTNRLPDQMPVEVTPMVLSRFDLAYWQGDRYSLVNHIRRFDPVTEEMFRKQGPEDTYILARLVEALKDAGAAVGPEGVINTSVSAVSGAATAGQATLSTINALARQIYDDAVKQFGAKVASSNAKQNLVKMARFMKAHPSYPGLMRQLKEMPGFLLPMKRSALVPPSSSIANSVPQARYFAKNYFKSFSRWNTNKYMGSIAKQLNGRVQVFKTISRGATWYLPAGIALYSVYDAPMETKLRTLFEEGFGIIGGWGGTELGGVLGTIIAVSILGLGPLGLFVVVFFCATAGGIAGNYFFRNLGGKVYDLGSHVVYDNVYHSPEELFEGIQ